MALDQAPANPRMPSAFVNRDGTLSQDGLTTLEEMWRQVVAGFVVVPCRATTASNVITLRPTLHREGAATYADHMVFAFVADATTNGTVTAKVTDGQKDLGTKKVYINGGATQAGSGDIIDDRLYFAAYNAALDTAAGGLVLLGVLTSGGIVGFTEDVQDIAGAMVASNTETNIAVTYDDPNGKLDFSVFPVGTLTNWTSANTDIDGLISGSAVGALIQGESSGHFTFGLRDNDANDGFQWITGSGNWTTDSTYDLLAMELKAGGALTVAGTITSNGTVITPEVGTFTPTMAFATVGTSTWAYTTQSGFYIKIGRLVQVWIVLAATPTIGTGTGNVRPSDLPFASDTVSFPLQVGFTDADWTWPAGRTSLYATSNSGQTYLELQGMGSAVANASVTAANMVSGNEHTLRISGAYRAAS